MLVADAPEGPQPFTAEMIVATFPLNRFNDDGRDIRASFGDALKNLLLRFFFPSNCIGFPLGRSQRKINIRTRDTRPIELRK